MKKFIKSRIIDPVSISGVRAVVRSDAELREIWEKSMVHLPSLGDHFTTAVAGVEMEHRIRLLVAAEALFAKRAITTVLDAKETCSYADIGDSDGSLQLLLRELLGAEKLSSVGINLQESAVAKIRARGLEGIRADAALLAERGACYDIVSVFETLEHLPDPIGFLKGIGPVVNERLIVSVPFIRRSRVGLAHIPGGGPGKWPEEKKPTIENVHIFELSRQDWRKVFWHSGWRVTAEWELMMYPFHGWQRLVLQPFWRAISFEGFWFALLCKDDRHAARYGVE